MKKFYRALAVLMLSCVGSFSAIAQDDLGQYLHGNIEDASKLFGAYVNPALKSISLGLNQGWYNTAKPHKMFGVDLTITVNAMMVPDKELWYNPESILGPNARIQLDASSPAYPKAPTLFGPTGSSNEPVFNVVYEGNKVESYNGAPGVLDIKKEIGNTIVPVPMANLGIGLPKGTDLKIRFMPEMSIGDGSVKMFGVGVMHDVKQWIPGMKNLPFDLSGFVGFTKLDFNVDIDNPDYDNQKAQLSISATTVQGVISKKISVLTVYGSAGYNIAKSNLAMKGTYYIGQDPSTGEDVEMDDPVTIKTAASGPRIGAGFRLKLAVFTLHADYTLQKYRALTVGFGISVR